MPYRFDLHRRIEAVHTLDNPIASRLALRAEVHDPAWFLTRQWQLGEHRGEDAASPVRVHLTLTETPLTHASAGPVGDPRDAPPEATVESEPEQWWTGGRRIRVGRALRTAVPPARRNDPALLLAGLAPPYDLLNGRVLDGLALYRARNELGLAPALFTDLGVPASEPEDDWKPAELAYASSFEAGPITLDVPHHDGGDLDWFSTTASGSLPRAPDDTVVKTAHPTRVSYPGSPHPRWWQIEDHRRDPGAVAPHRTYLASLLTVQVASSHGDDWFTAPVISPSGSLLTVRDVRVEDSMGMRSVLRAPTDWSMFRVSGLGTNQLLVWPTLSTRIAAASDLDEVLLGIDEDANLLWAIERRVDGAEVVEPPAAPEPPVDDDLPGQVVVTSRRRYRYLPSSTVPRLWHPYLLSRGAIRRFVQARLADLSARPVAPFPGPVTRLLRNPRATSADPDHEILPAAIPRRGLRVQRRYVLGRAASGQPLLWIQRRRSPLEGPPVSGLRFDVLEELPEVVAGEA